VATVTRTATLTKTENKRFRNEHRRPPPGFNPGGGLRCARTTSASPAAHEHRAWPAGTPARPAAGGRVGPALGSGGWDRGAGVMSPGSKALGWLNGFYRVYLRIVLVLRYLRRERDTPSIEITVSSQLITERNFMFGT
jgi:hypothetical protein